MIDWIKNLITDMVSVPGEAIDEVSEAREELIKTRNMIFMIIVGAFLLWWLTR